MLDLVSDDDSVPRGDDWFCVCLNMLLQMLIQASEYEKEQELSLSHFFESTEGSFTHPEIIELVKELYVQRANHMMGME